MIPELLCFAGIFNDLGMFSMAQSVEKVLKKFFLKERGYKKWN